MATLDHQVFEQIQQRLEEEATRKDVSSQSILHGVSLAFNS